MNKKSIYIRISKALWIAFCAFFLLIFIYIYTVNVNLFNLYGEMPDFQALENPTKDLSSELYSTDGILIGKYFRENRSPIEYEHISPNVVEALLATEDARFESHSGIDFRGLFRVFFKTILLRQESSGGGSTISQQLAKNLFNTRSAQYKGLLSQVPLVRTFILKTKEWLTAVRIERSYTKREIMSMYLNTVDFGNNAFGIKVAAKTYFNRTPDSLNRQEAALLVGLLKAPTRYNPRTNPKSAFERRNTVLHQLYRYDYMTREELDSLQALPIELLMSSDAHDEGLATYFRTVVRNYLLGWCEKHGYDLFADGLKIYTTIDSRMQKYAEEAVDEHMADLQNHFFQHWKDRNPWVDEHMVEIPRFIEQAAKRTERYQQLKDIYGEDTLAIQNIMNKPVPMKVFSWKGEKDTLMSPMDSIRYYKHFLHAGLMSMDPKTGFIKAWVGGINYKYFKYDHVKQGKRQGGSTFKAFVYAAAMENEFSPCFEVVDAPVTFIINEHTNEVWTPDNSDKSYTGNKLSIRQGLGRSINSVSAYLLKRIGINNVISIAVRLGISAENLKPVPSVALGSTDVSVYEMVGAYATFANKGTHIDPFFIDRIEDKNGNVLQQFIPKSTDAISEETAYLMLHLLKGSTQEAGGTALGLYRYGVLQYNEVAAKTGTTSNQSDGWFIGLTKDLATGVWVGGEDRSIHFRDLENGQGSRMAMPIWALYMKRVYQDTALHITKGYFPKTDNEEILQKIDCKRYKNIQISNESDSSEYVIPKDPPIEDLN